MRKPQWWRKKGRGDMSIFEIERDKARTGDPGREKTTFIYYVTHQTNIIKKKY